METLHSGRVGHLELILDDRDVYYVKVGSKSSVTCVAPATFPGICTPPVPEPQLNNRHLLWSSSDSFPAPKQ